MRVVFRQSGGFAGLTRGVELDTEKMPKKDALELERLVGKVGDVEPKVSSPAIPDAIVYEIGIEDGKGVRRLRFDDGGITRELGELVELLQASAARR